MNFTKRIIAILVVCFAHLSAGAADESPNYFSYFPGSPLAIRGGFVQKDLTKQFVTQCVEGDVIDANPNTGILYSQVEIFLVRDYESLLEKIGFDVNVSAHTPLSGIDASYREQRQKMSSRSSLTAIVQISAEFSPKAISNAKLNPTYEKYLDEGRVDDFIKECGARVVVKERRGVMLNAIITIANSSAETLQKIDVSMNAKYGSASFTAEAKAAFNKEFASATTSNRVNVNFKAIGGVGSDAFEQAISASIKDVTSLDGIGQAIATYAKTLTKDNAGVLGFFVADMPKISVLQSDPWILEKQTRLARLKKLYLVAADKRDAINALVEHSDPRWQAYSVDGLKKLEAHLADADKLISSVIKQHSTCKTSTESEFLNGCDISPQVTSAVSDLKSFALIGPPDIRHSLQVRTGFDADVTKMSDWHFADDRAFIRLLNRPKMPADDDYEFSTSAGGYMKEFFRAVPAEVPNATRAIAGVLVTSEYLEGITLEFVADQSTFKNGYAYAPWVHKIFGEAELQGGDLDPEDLGRILEADGKRNYFTIIQAGLIANPPPEPAGCFGIFTSSKKICAEYNEKYGQDIGVFIKQADQAWPWIDLSLAVSNWIASGGSDSGAGRYILRAKDRFGGESIFTVMSFQWDTDRNLQLARVNYGLGTSAAKSTWFLTGMGSVSSNFPKMEKTYTWTVTGPATHDFQQLKDRWGEIDIKYCPSSASGEPSARVDTKRKTAQAILTNSGNFTIEVTLKAVARNKRQSFFGPGFFESDDGC